MNAVDILTVSAVVVVLTQYAKWRGVPDRHGPTAVVVLSAIGVLVWGWSQSTFSRETSFEFLAGFASVLTSASGVYGLTRASATALTKLLPPPSGAGAEPTARE